MSEKTFIVAGELIGIKPEDFWWALQERRCRYCAGDIAFFVTGEKGETINVVACRRCLWKCKITFTEATSK